MMDQMNLKHYIEIEQLIVEIREIVEIRRNP